MAEFSFTLFCDFRLSKDFWIICGYKATDFVIDSGFHNYSPPQLATSLEEKKKVREWTEVNHDFAMVFDGLSKDHRHSATLAL